MDVRAGWRFSTSVRAGWRFSTSVRAGWRHKRVSMGMRVVSHYIMDVRAGEGLYERHKRVSMGMRVVSHYMDVRAG